MAKSIEDQINATGSLTMPWKIECIRLMKEYGFTLSDKDSYHWIVVDPKLPKGKGTHNGGNLYTVIQDAIRARIEYETKKPYVFNIPSLETPVSANVETVMITEIIPKEIIETIEEISEPVAEKSIPEPVEIIESIISPSEPIEVITPPVVKKTKLYEKIMEDKVKNQRPANEVADFLVEHKGNYLVWSTYREGQKAKRKKKPRKPLYNEPLLYKAYCLGYDED